MGKNPQIVPRYRAGRAPLARRASNLRRRVYQWEGGSNRQLQPENLRASCNRGSESRGASSYDKNVGFTDHFGH